MSDVGLLRTLIFIAGILQLVLILASPAIPRVLGWSEQVAKLRPLTRQVFWTYAAYIWSINLAFGLISTIAPQLLLEGRPLSACVSGFIAAYWLTRVGIQFFYFDRSDLPQGRVIRLADMGLTTLFVGLSIVYGWALFANVQAQL